jgi:hypothetical protein
MRFDALAAPLEQAIVQQLGTRLASLSADETSPRGDFSLRESFRTWVLDIGEVVPEDRSIESFRRRIDLWHHQIWSHGRPSYIARSAIYPDTGPDELPIRLCEVSLSPLAAQIDSTLAWVDAHANRIGEPAGSNWQVRLLIAPRFNFFGLGFFEEEVIQKVATLSGPSELGPRVIDAVDLRQQILGRRVVFGLGEST